MIEPFIGQIVDAIHQAFSLAIGNALWLGVGAAALAAVIVAVRAAARPPAATGAEPGRRVATCRPDRGVAIRLGR